jgi:hypothetical protein
MRNNIPGMITQFGDVLSESLTQRREKSEQQSIVDFFKDKPFTPQAIQQFSSLHPEVPLVSVYRLAPAISEVSTRQKASDVGYGMFKMILGGEKDPQKIFDAYKDEDPSIVARGLEYASKIQGMIPKEELTKLSDRERLLRKSPLRPGEMEVVPGTEPPPEEYTLSTDQIRYRAGRSPGELPTPIAQGPGRTVKMTLVTPEGIRTDEVAQGDVADRLNKGWQQGDIKPTATNAEQELVKSNIRQQLAKAGINREPTPQEIMEGVLAIEGQKKVLSPEAMKQQIEIAGTKAKQAITLKDEQQTKDIDIPSLAEAVADGRDARMAIKGSMGNPVASKVESEVLKKYPNFNFMMSDANYRWKQSSTNQRTINFAGGALPRLTMLDEQLKKVPNVDLNIINRAMRFASVETGKHEYTDFESNRNAIVQEINTALSGSSTTSDMRVKIELENLQSARSPGQIRGAISNLREALIARLDTDLSPIYPTEVVQGKKTLEQYKNDMFKKYRGNYSESEQVGGKNEKTVVKKFVSPSTGKTKYIYSDGTEEIR